MAPPYHSKILQNKISACVHALNRVSLVNGTQHQESPKISTDKENGKRVPLISLPGIDRIQNPNYSKTGKRLWSLFLLLCAVGCFYQIVSCFIEYFAGEAAIDVNFENIDAAPIPELLFCPADLLGKNVLTDNLRLKYKELFNSSTEDVYFSDFLRIPNVTVDSLWDLNGLKPEKTIVEMKCSPMKNDDSCAQLLVKSVKTSSGTCVSVSFVGKFVGKDSSVRLRIVYPQPPKIWIISNLYCKFLYMSMDANPAYHAIQDGIPLHKGYCLRVQLEIEKIINLNLPNKPCLDSRAVENCTDKCIERKLYSSLPCRLPYLLNDSLPLCKDPKSFNKSLAIAAEVLRRKVECEISCPRKCEEYIFIPSADMPPKMIEDSYIDFILDIRRIMLIREVYWYKLSSLFSDVGGFLGIFLGICLLNFFESINVLIHKIKVLSDQNVRHMKPDSQATQQYGVNRTEDSNHVFAEHKGVRVKNIRGRNQNEAESDFLISITGLDRILNASVGKRRKILWICCLMLAFAIWLFQLIATISDFIEALPDIKIEYERNGSLKFPTFTFCPGDPFTYSEKIQTYKEYYIQEFNKTDKNNSDVSLSDLLNFPELNVSQLWTLARPEKLSVAMFKFQHMLGLANNENYSPPTQSYKETIYGSCLSVTAPEMIPYQGLATNEFLCVSVEAKVDHPNNVKLFIHDDYDEINFLDLNRGRLLSLPAVLVMLGVKKIERLHHPRRPCASKAAVVSCQIECFNTMLKESSVNCSLPFMKGFLKPMCSSSADFNRSMEISKLVLETYMKKNNCNCPIPLEEYLFDAEFGQYPEALNLPNTVTALPILFKSNSWIILKDYYKVGVNGVFANICGSMGLYLGICIPSFVEIIEYCILVVKTKSKTKVRRFSL